MEEKLIDHLTAMEAAHKVLGVINPFCSKAYLAGSLRRGKEKVHDVDIVVNVTDYIGFKSAFKDLTLEKELWFDKNDLKRAKIIRFLYKAVPMDIYIAEPDGSNFEALFQMRTGSEKFNISLAVRAKKLKLKYQGGHGIYDGEKRIDDGTEAGIFVALQLPNIPPADREGGYQDFMFKKGRDPLVA
jgi:DNA polymerase/3'-5' exonuclease PolX